MIKPVRNETLSPSDAAALQRLDRSTRERERLLADLQKNVSDSNRAAYAAFDGGTITGVFAFDHFDKQYLVMTEWLCGTERDGREMLALLRERFSGYTVEFSLRPDERVLHALLNECGATVFPEQQNMRLTGTVPQTDTQGIEMLSAPYLPQYVALHENSDAFLDGEDVAAKPETCRALLAIENGTVLGYLDLTRWETSANISDLYVDEAHRNRGCGARLLAKAIELTRSDELTLQVDVDNPAAIHLYEKMGFTVIPGRNCIDALWEIP